MGIFSTLGYYLKKNFGEIFSVTQTFQILYVTEFWTTDPIWGIIHPK
jgi:hypothetical protein